MRFLIPTLLIAVLGLSACNSRWNPGNWFGNSREVAVDENVAEDVNPLIPTKTGMLARPEVVYPGIPVQKITELKVERVENGALLRVKGVAYVQGAFDVRLSPLNEGKPVSGVLSFELLAIHPKKAQRGPERTREVLAGYRLTDQQLEGVRTIKVVGLENARQSRR